MNLLAFISVLLAAFSVLPGSLGILKFTHKFTARPVGAFLTYVVSVPLYFLSLLLLAVALYFRHAAGGPAIIPLLATLAFVALSVFGFLMHTRFMFRPVRQPRYISLEEAIQRFGEKEEIIGVLDSRGRPFAYIARLARRPHIVYQTESDSRFIMSHCILSHSSMAYELHENFFPNRIFISSVLANNLVFYDQTNHCSILQIYNSSPDKRRPLRCLPTVMTSLAAWKHLYPESRVWVREREWRDTFYLKLLARASVIDSKSSDLVYPLANAPDPRLPLKSYVLGVELNGNDKAFPVELFQQHTMIEDVVGDEPLVFFASRERDYIQLYSRRTKQKGTLNFRPRPVGGFQDSQTSSVWNEKGACLAGELEGVHLTPIPHYNKIFWCVWADFHPSTALYTA